MTTIELKVLNSIDLSPCSGCDQCGLRCAAGVPVDKAEHDRVDRWICASSNSEYISAVQLQDKRVDLGDGVVVQMCRYRDMHAGRCSIYPVRPMVCRLMGHVEWMPCPIDKVETIARTEDALELMADRAQRTQHTFEEWQSLASGRASL